MTLRFGDVPRLGLTGMRSRPGRTVLTALGIAIGIAALVSVVGISYSSRADLLAELDRLGTNLLQVRAGQDVFGEDAELPEEAPDMVRRVGPVEQAAAVAHVSATVRRTDRISELETGAISVMAAEVDLLDTLGATVQTGRWLDDGLSDTPTVVLGATAARRLGITSLTGSPLVWIGDQWFAVVGILDPVPLLGSLDSSVFIGGDAAATLCSTGTARSRRSSCGPRRRSVDDVRDVLAATVNPLAPNEVEVSRPTDALEARVGRRSRAHGAPARARRGRAARRRHRHRQRDGHLGARTPFRDRGAAGDRRDPPPHPAAVPDRGGDPRLDRWRRWRTSRLGRSRPATHGPRTSRSRCRRSRSRAAWARRSSSGCWPACSPPAAPPASPPPKPSACEP